jgi:ribokinase
MKLRCTLRADSVATDVIAVGELSLDTVIHGAWLMQPGVKQEAELLIDAPGGMAATLAVALARLGWRTRLVGVVGNDPAGDELASSYSREGVGLSLVTRRGARTRRAILMVDERTRDRSVLEFRDPALDLREGDVSDAVFTGARILTVDGSDPDAAIRAARVARQSGARTIVDLDAAVPHANKLLELIDVIILPEHTVAELTGFRDVSEGLEALGRSTHAAAVVATLGSAGAVAWCDGKEVRSPAARSDVRDTTGAGDAFRAGFAASWLTFGDQPPDLEQLLADANLVAALNCRGIGAQAGLPRADEVPGRLRGRV